MTVRPDLEWLNGLPDAEAETELLTCCGSWQWASMVAAGRPYASVDRLAGAADAAMYKLSWFDVEEALAAHPRIGDHAGDAAARREQSGVDGTDAAATRALADGNVAYEKRFGHVFLIRASGREAGEILAELNARLGNDPETERRIVRAELAEITTLRLRRLFT